MKTTVALLRKVRTTKNEWQYIVNGSVHNVSTAGAVVEQFIDVVEDMKKNYYVEGSRFVIISRSLINEIEVELDELYPELTFLKLKDVSAVNTFTTTFNQPSVKKRAASRTLFIASDASGGRSHSSATWAWATSGASASYNMGVCPLHDTNLAEFEGLLRAIIDNQYTACGILHIYSDSLNALEMFEKSVRGDMPLRKDIAGYFKPMVAEARRVMARKTVKTQWVRSHRSHRLNTVADFLSRHARKNNFHGVIKTEAWYEADAMMEMCRR